jgi:hypothetical protein
MREIDGAIWVSVDGALALVGRPPSGRPLAQICQLIVTSKDIERRGDRLFTRCSRCGEVRPLVEMGLRQMPTPAVTPGDLSLSLRVGQLPNARGEPWVGRAVFGAEAPKARHSFVIHAPLGLDLERPLVGLLIDAWSETIPARTHTAAVAFHVEQPTACPPQLIALAVAPDLTVPAWTDDAVEAAVRETLELARLRLVDGDLIGAAGHYLPALYFGINLANDTASTDFTGADKS